MMLGSAKDGDVELVKIFNSISIWQVLVVTKHHLTRKFRHNYTSIIVNFENKLASFFFECFAKLLC